MRLRSLVITTLLTTAALPLLQGSAQAAGETVLRSGLPAGWESQSVNCSTSEVGTGSAVYGPGPATPPLGTGSLRLVAPADQQLFLVNSPAVAASNVSALSVGAYRYAVADDTFLIANMDDNGDGTPERQLVTQTSGNGWSTLNLLTAPLKAYDYGGSASADTTWSAYKAAHPATVLTVFGIGGGCAPSTVTMPIDNLRFQATAFDFEAPVADKVTISPTAATISWGGAVTIRGSVTASLAPIVSQPVELWKKAWNATVFSKVATVTSGNNGSLVSVQRPTGRTVYQWRVPGGTVVSGVLTVSVRATLTLHVFDSTLTRTQTLYAWGVTQTALRTTTVSLYRYGTSTVLATAKVQSDGTYAFTKAIGAAGKYTLQASSPGSSTAGLLGGKSALVVVTVA